MPRSHQDGLARAHPGVGIGPSTCMLAFWLCTLLIVVAVWVSGLLVPYFVNDLDQLPLHEVASGMHDPKDLWPYASGSAPSVMLRGALLALALPLMPLLGLGSAATGAGLLLFRREHLTTSARNLTATVVLLAIIMATVSLSPFGRALATWAVD